MFPGVDGFAWDVGHVVFLGAFFTVLAVLAGAVTWAASAAILDVRARRIPELRWCATFADLPAAARVCRHAITGASSRRVCSREFACGACPDHEALAARHVASAVPLVPPAGLQVPADRLFHRGHTWIRREPDGTATVGLDDLAELIIGDARDDLLPAPGTRLATNGVAWTVRAGSDEVRVLSPIAGEVVGVGGRDREWYLRVRPDADPPDTRHLLSGDEAGAWMAYELQRLLLAMGDPATGAALADGGELVRDLHHAAPREDWQALRGMVLLNP